MRGETERQATLMLGLTPEGFVPRGHPLRRIKPLVDSALGRMSLLFDEVYAAGGRPSIPPEQLLKSSLLMAFYTIRSERQFCEQLRYNILFKWFLDLNVEDEPFHPTTFAENRERLMESDAARAGHDRLMPQLGEQPTEPRRVGPHLQQHATPGRRREAALHGARRRAHPRLLDHRTAGIDHADLTPGIRDVDPDRLPRRHLGPCTLRHAGLLRAWADPGRAR